MAGVSRVDFERITQVYREESGKKQLVELEPDFYDAASEYLRRLERETTKAAEKNATSSKTQFLQDELRKSRKRLEQIYQYRERKIALLAQSKASGVETEPQGLTTQEQDLFNRLIGVLQEARGATFLGGQADTKPPETVSIEGTNVEEQESAALPPKPAQPKRKTVTVYILEDVPPFAGIDVTYKLMKEDVVSMPEEYASVLVKRGAAKIVDVH